jgi:lauroyl/myristoyl acyltransferase
MLNYIKNIIVSLIWRIVFFFLRGVLLLPRAIWHKIGGLLGLLLFMLMKKRKAIIKKNIELCFPNIGAAKQKDLCNKNMQELGIGVLDFFVLRFKSNAYIAKQAELIGFELMQQAVQNKKGVIIFLPHTSAMCLTIGALSQLLPISVLHRPFKHDALRAILHGISHKIGMRLVAQRDVKNIIQTLKNRENLVVLSDHDMGRVGAIFANFFGIKAATNVSIFKLAKSTGAKIINVYSYRLNNGGICIEFGETLNNYCNSSHDDAATAMNEYLEFNIKRFAGQYYWPHRKFKTRPCNEGNLY